MRLSCVQATERVGWGVFGAIPINTEAAEF